MRARCTSLRLPVNSFVRVKVLFPMVGLFTLLLTLQNVSLGLIPQTLTNLYILSHATAVVEMIVVRQTVNIAQGEEMWAPSCNPQI